MEQEQKYDEAEKELADIKRELEELRTRTKDDETKKQHENFYSYHYYTIRASIFFRPVCVLLSTENLKGFNIPIEQRTDRDFYVKVFQQKNNEWYQCKTYLSRLFFF